MKQGKPVMILVAEDDAEDRMLTRDALGECQVEFDLRFVDDGEELLDYLRRSGRYADAGEASPWPELILLDLKMPRKDGFEVIQEIKSDPALRGIPVVVLTTSAAEEDIRRSYDLGVNSYLTKPTTYSAMVTLMKQLGAYWFGTVELPRHGR